MKKHNFGETMMSSENVLPYLIACLMAATSFILNRWLWKRFGNIAVISYSPLVEELAKTLPAYFLGANIFMTHMTFGLIEAVYDWVQSNSEAKAVAALLSVVGHSAFGGITWFILSQYFNIWLAVCGGVLCHVLWNMLVVRYNIAQKGG